MVKEIRSSGDKWIDTLVMSAGALAEAEKKRQNYLEHLKTYKEQLTITT